jgi:DNA-binding transcriptional MocR family regulator
MLMDNSLHENIEFLKKTHTDRLYTGLWKPIQQHLVPLGCSTDIRPKGGYFVWLKLPITATRLLETIDTHQIQVGVGAGTKFVVSIDPAIADYYVRLSFAHYDTHTLQVGIGRLKEALSIALNDRVGSAASL